MLSHAQLQLAHSWHSKGGDEHRQQEPSLWWPPPPPLKQQDHNPSGFYSLQPAFPPFPCAQQAHFPSPSTNMGSVRMKGQRAGKTFLLGSQYHFRRQFIWGHMRAHAVWTKEKLVAVSRACEHSEKQEQTPLSRAAPETLAYQQARELLGRTHFNGVRRH